MLLIRELMFCKPGKVRPLVEKFLAMNMLGVKVGMPPMKVMTDVSAERYWTVVAEMEEIMKDYHDLVESGRREIYRLAGQRQSSLIARRVTASSPARPRNR